MKELPILIASLILILATSVKLPLVLTLLMYAMKASTGLFPSKVGVHLSATESGPVLTTPTFVGGSGRSKVGKEAFNNYAQLKDTDILSYRVQ